MLLSLDLSTKSSGWAVFNGEQLMDHGCYTSASTDMIKRIHIMIDGIQSLLDKYTDIDTIVVEEVRPEGGYGVGNQKTHKALMYLQAALEFLVHDNYSKRVNIEYIYPNSWRAAIGIKTGRGVKRTSLKEADIAFVKEIFGITVNDDEADAICIGFAHNKEVNNEINWE